MWWDDTRGMEVQGKLTIVSRDRTRALEIDPHTLKATPIAPPHSTRPPFAPTLASHLAAGFCTSPDAWLGLHGLWTPEVTWTLLAIGVIGGAANLAIRRPQGRVAA